LFRFPGGAKGLQLYNNSEGTSGDVWEKELQKCSVHEQAAIRECGKTYITTDDNSIQSSTTPTSAATQTTTTSQPMTVSTTPSLPATTNSALPTTTPPTTTTEEIVLWSSLGVTGIVVLVGLIYHFRHHFVTSCCGSKSTSATSPAPTTIEV